MRPLRIDRRRFLALSAAAAALPRRARAQNSVALVIGAGVAGLSAARILIAEGFTPIVLEARGHVGGRIATDRTWPDCPVDLGASWIHGIDGNPVVSVLRDAHLQTARTRDDDAVLYHPDGTPPTADEEDALDQLSGALADFVGEAGFLCGDDQGLDFETLARSEFPDEFAAAGPLARAALFDTIEGDFALDASAISACRIGDDQVFGGADVMLVKGYDAIATHLAEGLDIRLGTKVDTVEITSNGVRISTDKGPVDGLFVVVTVPLGVLAAEGIRFLPGLPDAHRGAIERIGRGALAKTYLRFAERFWDDVTWISRLAPEGDGFFDFLNVGKLHKAPVLVSFAAGDFAREVEAMAEADLSALLGEVMRGLYGSSAPAPEAIRRHAWTRDPLCGLSYSAPALGLRAGDRAALGEPIEGRIAFAGEAVSPDHPGTVHGAILTGVRAAQRLARRG